MKALSTHAHAAKLIRKELKSEFPGIKFSVTSESYSGGNNVNVGWENGPTQKEVESIINKYQEGHFDGMTDSYEYSNNRKDIPQVMFVFANREITNDIYQQVFDLHFRTFTDFENVKSIEESLDRNGRWTNVKQECRRILCKLDLRMPLTQERLWDAR